MKYAMVTTTTTFEKNIYINEMPRTTEKGLLECF